MRATLHNFENFSEIRFTDEQFSKLSAIVEKAIKILPADKTLSISIINNLRRFGVPPYISILGRAGQLTKSDLLKVNKYLESLSGQS